MKLIVGILDSLVAGAIRRISASGRHGETFGGRRIMQHYGLASSPPNDCEVLLLEDGGLVVSIAEDDRRYRIELASGEMAIYTDEGDKIHLMRDRKIEILGQAEVLVSSSIINLGGARAELKKLIDERLADWVNAHVHTSAAAGAPTSAPTVPLVVANVATDITRAK